MMGDLFGVDWSFVGANGSIIDGMASLLEVPEVTCPKSGIQNTDERFWPSRMTYS
jgi:hypothetical protein